MTMSASMEKVYLLSGLRSHMGRKNGIFRSTPPEILGGRILSALSTKINAFPEIVLLGNANGTGGNPARLSGLYAGFDQSIPGITIDMQCCSGMEAIIMAYSRIRSGLNHLVFAGGIESASLSPIRQYQPQDPRASLRNPVYQSAQFSPDDFSDTAMLKGASHCALRYHVSKEEMDLCAIDSHKKAAASTSQVSSIIFPLFHSTHDEGIHPKLNKQLLSRLNPIASHGITAGNTSQLFDGAGIVALCSESYVQQNHCTPSAELIGFAEYGGEPNFSPEASVCVITHLLHKYDLSPSQIQAFEVNEAFAVIDFIFAHHFPECISRYNQLGGALAYGHAFAVSGALLLLHLMLRLSPGQLGICSIAGAGGLGTALLVKKI